MTSKPRQPSSSGNTGTSANPDIPPGASAHHRLATDYSRIAERMKNRYAGTGQTAYQCLAGEVAYNAVKQGINAIANLDGRDPKGNREKLVELDRIQQAFPKHPGLKGLSLAALNLHFHTDQAELTDPQWQLQYQRTTQLISILLEIYRSKTEPHQPSV